MNKKAINTVEKYNMLSKGDRVLVAVSGGADSMALSQGISEALINTAFGILTGALAVISYNYYTNKIDKLTYSLDEVGFSIVQTFAATH